jgi:uncharacterized protein (DUF1501 family)
MMSCTRRRFIRTGLTVVTAGTAVPPWLSRAAEAAGTGVAAKPPVAERILVVVQLSGGNDGLNTLIPYSDRLYRERRPTLAVPETRLSPLTSDLAMHANLARLRERYDRKQLAIVQGVGYPNPNRSHFRSMEIWHTAAPEKVIRTGWIGRTLDRMQPGPMNPLLGLNVGNELPKAVIGEKGAPASLDGGAFGLVMSAAYPSGAMAAGKVTADGDHHGNLALLQQTTVNATVSAERLQAAAKRYPEGATYPNTPFARGLQQVARVIAGDLGTRVYYVSTGGFDTHSGQAPRHETLLTTLSEGLAAFQSDLERLGRADRVVTMVFSEFGRRAAENASAGTDHGAAGSMFLLGPRITGGLYGRAPSLSDLENGDLRHTTDFRSVYATVLARWLGVDPGPILGAEFPLLPCL